MNKAYQDLPHHFLTSGTLITQNISSKDIEVNLDDSADTMMTDFKYVRPFSTTITATLGDINQKMIACGVRLLFVADSNDALLGLVTYNDINGEKPLRYLQENGGSRDEISAQDIMTPLMQLEALDVANVQRARIGDIVQTMKSTGRQHILVVENHGDGAQTISGLFSSTHIEKRTGMKIELSPRANTFSELERAINE